MTKTSVIHIRLTPDEKAAIEICSTHLLGNKNTSTLLRKLIRQFLQCPNLMAHELAEFSLAVRQLTGIARNLNQITRVMNTTKSFHSNITPRYLQQINQQVDKVNQTLLIYIKQSQQRVIHHE